MGAANEKGKTEEVRSADQHHEVVDVTTTRRPKILMIVANPTQATTTG